tara:strand:- start:611 stop:1468 length:858 start_codon:yes stop_codon:yes gene_type:complete
MDRTNKYIATGGGGMGNQIKKLVSAKRLHPDSQTDLGYFNELFANQDLYHNNNRRGIEMCTWRFLVLPEDNEIPNNFNVHTTGNEVIGQGFTWHDPYSHWSFNEDGRNVDCEYLRIPDTYRNKILKVFKDYLQVHSNIQYYVDEFKKEYGQFASVHLRSYNADGFVKNGANRGGDVNPRAKARHQYWNNVQRTQLYEYVKQLKEDVVYISSDNRSEIESLKSSCPTKKFIHYTDVYEKPFESDYSNDFLDMVLLSKGVEMVLCRISTYSEVAWYLSNCNKNIKLY